MRLNYPEYKQKRKDYLYYKILTRILTILSDEKQNSIIDIGSKGMDLISELPQKIKYSVCLVKPLDSPKVKSFKMDFFDFRSDIKFDIVTCFQVIEHIKKAEDFIQKLQNTGDNLLISLPYKWDKNICRYHYQDPIDENKIFSWTKRKPTFTWYCKDKDHLNRIICLYAENLSLKKYLLLKLIPKRNNFYKKRNILSRFRLLLLFFT